MLGGNIGCRIAGLSDVPHPSQASETSPNPPVETEASPKLRISPDFTPSSEHAAILRIFEEHPWAVLTVRKIGVLAGSDGYHLADQSRDRG